MDGRGAREGERVVALRILRTVHAHCVPPMDYLLRWRMAVAKRLLRTEDASIAEVAERVGYGSASTFSTAFSRHVGQAPGRYARAVVANRPFV